jgi:hypothetical protein
LLIHRHIADLIQEKSATMGRFEAADRRRESALFMSDELGFQEAGRPGHEKGAFTGLVNGTGAVLNWPMEERLASSVGDRLTVAEIFAVLS